jgi:hypothetical protein
MDSVNELRPNNEAPKLTKLDVPIPNEELGGFAHVGSSAPLTHALDIVHSPNIDQSYKNIDDKIGGTYPLTRSASTTDAPNEKMRFKVGEARMPQPESAKSFGKGSVPVIKGNPSIPMKRGK